MQPRDETSDDLTHILVHDLRNPLGNIYTALLMIEEADADNLSPNQRMMLNIASSNARRMLRLVNRILDVYKLESGCMRLQCTSVPLVDLITETLRVQSPLAAAKDLRLESDLPSRLSPAWADAGLIEQVLQNLVDNAVKFTPPGGKVQVVVRQSDGETGRQHDLEATPSPHLRVSVVDSGPGIAADLKSRLFQKFVTGRGEGSGSGLGLAFCKLVVEAHGGRIWVENEAGHGATFVFTLPMACE